MTKAEYNKIKKVCKTLSQDKLILAQKLLDEIMWMDETIQKLKQQVDKDGPVIKATNGNGFEVLTEHPAQKSYNAMIKNYNSTIRQLQSIIPEASEGLDELELFLKS